MVDGCPEFLLHGASEVLQLIRDALQGAGEVWGGLGWSWACRKEEQERNRFSIGSPLDELPGM